MMIQTPMKATIVLLDCRLLIMVIRSLNSMVYVSPAYTTTSPYCTSSQYAGEVEVKTFIPPVSFIRLAKEAGSPLNHRTRYEAGTTASSFGRSCCYFICGYNCRFSGDFFWCISTSKHPLNGINDKL